MGSTNPLTMLCVGIFISQFLTILETYVGQTITSAKIITTLSTNKEPAFFILTQTRGTQHPLG